MHILHTPNGWGGSFKIPPFGTMFVFDADELPFVERIVQGLVDMYDGEERDSFYYQLVSILNQVRVSHTQEEVQ